MNDVQNVSTPNRFYIVLRIIGEAIIPCEDLLPRSVWDCGSISFIDFKECNTTVPTPHITALFPFKYIYLVLYFMPTLCMKNKSVIMNNLEYQQIGKVNGKRKSESEYYQSEV